jgi:hypothetical protein
MNTIIITNTTANNANAKPLIPVDGKPPGDASQEVKTEGLEYIKMTKMILNIATMAVIGIL